MRPPPNLALQRTPHRGGVFSAIMAYLGGAGPLSLGVSRWEDHPLRITLNRFTTGLLLVLLAPVVLTIKLINAVTGRGKKPVYASTIGGDPLTYSGDRPLLIAVWAPWASVWRAATGQVVEQLRGEFAGRCEFAYVECTTKEVKDAYHAEVVPVLILRHRGQELSRFVNTLEADKVRQAIAEVAV